MTEINRFMFESMVGHIDKLGKFVSAVAKNEIRKASEVREQVAHLREDLKKFATLLQNPTTAGGRAGSAKAMKGFKPGIRAILKVLDAIENGVTSGEMNLTSFRTTIKELIKPNLEKFVALGNTFEPSDTTDDELKKRIEFEQQRGGHKAALEVMRTAFKEKKKEAEEEKNEDKPVDDADAKAVMQEYAKWKGRLPSSLRGRMFSLIKVPIVPHGDWQLSNGRYLTRIGVEHRVIASSFAILENQMLLAFDYEKSTEYRGRKSSLEVSGLKGRKRAAKHNDMQEAFVQDVVSAINGPVSDQLALVCSHFEHHPTNPSITFAWLVPKRTYNVLCRNVKLADVTWGFPWSHDVHSIL